MINKTYEVVTNDDKVVSTDNVVPSLTDEGDAAVTGAGVLFEGVVLLDGVVLILVCVLVVVCFVVVVVGVTGDIVVVVVVVVVVCAVVGNGVGAGPLQRCGEPQLHLDAVHPVKQFQSFVPYL